MFSGGVVPAYAPCLKDLNAEATDKARDISAIVPTDKFKVLLPASFCPKDVPSQECPEKASGEAEDDSDSDDASFLDNSEDGEADEEHIFDLLTLPRSTVIARGSYATAKVHQVCENDDGSSELIPVLCKKRLKRSPKSRIETAELLRFGKYEPCVACQKIWPDHINTFFDCAKA